MLDDTTLLSGAALIISVIGTVFTAINHKRVRSKCCGRTGEISIDVDSTRSPIKIEIPPSSVNDKI